MRETLKKIHVFLSGLSVPEYVIFVPLVCYAVSDCFIGEIAMALGELVGITSYAGLSADVVDDRFWFSVVYALTAAPLIETLLFMSLPMAIISKIKPLSRYTLFIIADALVFGYFHGGPMELQKKLVTFLSGIMFAYTYTLFKEKKFHPFLMTAAVHAITNLCPVTYVLFAQFAQ